MGRRPRSSGDQSAAVLRRASQVRVLPRAPFFDIMKAVTDGPARAASSIDLPLVCPQGEPIDLLRTLTSHGVATLPPLAVDEYTCTLEVTVPIAGHRPRMVRVTRAGATAAQITVLASGRPTEPVMPSAGRWDTSFGWVRTCRPSTPWPPPIPTSPGLRPGRGA